MLAGRVSGARGRCTEREEVELTKGCSKQNQPSPGAGRRDLKKEKKNKKDRKSTRKRNKGWGGIENRGLRNTASRWALWCWDKQVMTERAVSAKGE